MDSSSVISIRASEFRISLSGKIRGNTVAFAPDWYEEFVVAAYSGYWV